LLEEKDINFFLAFVKREYSLDLSFYRKTFLMRRLAVRLNAVDVSSIKGYTDYLKANPQEWPVFIDHLSINVSKFFRDKEVFAEFKDTVLPRILKKKKESAASSIRIWSCGCSNGEEPYSLAILLNDFFSEQKEQIPFSLVASDVDSDALGKASVGEYSSQAMENVSSLQKETYFDQAEDGKYRVKDSLKSRIKFKKHNLFVDKPFPFMDVIFFRNVGIYLSADNTEKIFVNIHHALKQGGYLVLGKVETLRRSVDGYFQPVSLQNKIYEKI